MPAATRWPAPGPSSSGRARTRVETDEACRALSGRRGGRIPQCRRTRGSTMKHGMAGTRRVFLGALGALPMSLLGVRSDAQSRQLVLLSYAQGVTPARVFANKVAEASAGTIQVSVETTMSMPHLRMSTDSALAHYCT